MYDLKYEVKKAAEAIVAQQLAGNELPRRIEWPGSCLPCRKLFQKYLLALLRNHPDDG